MNSHNEHSKENTEEAEHEGALALQRLDLSDSPAHQCS